MLYVRHLPRLSIVFALACQVLSGVPGHSLESLASCGLPEAGEALLVLSRADPQERSVATRPSSGLGDNGIPLEILARLDSRAVAGCIQNGGTRYTASGRPEVQSTFLHASKLLVSAHTGALDQAAPVPGDGVENIFAIFIAGTQEYAWQDARDMFDFLVEKHRASSGNLFVLVTGSGIPPDRTDIVDGPATREQLAAAFAHCAARMDGDDVFLWQIETTGSGYLSRVDDDPNNLAYHGYLAVPPRIASEADERDLQERDLELSVFCGGGLLDGMDYHYGIGQWGVRWYLGFQYLQRFKVLSHFQNVHVEGLGSLSDQDVYLERFTDFALGDLNRNGAIDPGEIADFDGDGVPPFDRNTGAFDEDDWGPLDAFEDDCTSWHSPILGHSYVLFDRDLDNCADIDVDPGPVLEIDGTDVNNDGCIDGVDLDGDGRMDSWLAIDETMDITDATLTDDEVREYLDLLANGTKVVVTSTCYGGGFIGDLSGPNTIILTGGRENTLTPAGFVHEAFRRAFSSTVQEADLNQDGVVSIVEAANRARIHPWVSCSPHMDRFQYDDNGDGIGHESPLPDGGDGLLGAATHWSLFAPTVTQQPADLMVDSGQALTLSVRGDGIPVPACQWFKDGVPLAGATAPDLVIPFVRGADVGIYMASLNNAKGSVTSAAGTVSVRKRLRTYSGTTSDGGVWALEIHDDSGKLLAYLPSTRQVVRATVQVAGDGRLSDLAGEAVGTSATAFVSGAILSGSVAGAFGDGAVSLTGAEDGDSGTPAPFVGGYEAQFLHATTGASDVIVGSDGTVTMVLAIDGIMDGGIGTIDASGRVSVDLNSGGHVALQIDVRSGQLTGSVTPAVTGVPLAIAGASATTTRINRLVNLSTRGFVGNGDEVMIAGFVITGAGSKRMLIRAVGPTMANDPFFVDGAMSNPVVHLIRQSDGERLLSDDDWSDGPDAAELSNAFGQAGAFPLPLGSRDASLVADLPAGAYTAIIEGLAGLSGVALAELYTLDDDTAAGARLVNISTRGMVGLGDSVMIPGFTTAGSVPRRVLIRAVGPTLGIPPFNLSGVHPDPQLTVFLGGTPVASNDDWDAEGSGDGIAAIAEQVGAFPLPRGSRDSAMLFTVPPGRGYTVIVSGKGGPTGVAMAEIYEVP